MSDGTNEPDLADLDAALSAERAAEGGTSDGAPGGDEGDRHEPSTPDIDISKFPENEQEILRSLPPETWAPVVKRFNELKTGGLRMTEEAKRKIAEANKVIDKAQWAEGVQSNDELMARLLGLQGQSGGGRSGNDPFEDLPDPADLDLSDKAAFYKTIGMAMERTVAPTLEKRFKEMLESSEPVRDRKLDRAAQTYWQSLESRGVSLTPEQRTEAVKLWVQSEAEEGRDWKQTRPEDLPRMLGLAARAVLQSPQSKQPAAAAGTRTTSVPAAGGAPAPTRAQKPWERRGDKPTDDEIWELAGGMSGRDFEKLWQQERRMAR